MEGVSDRYRIHVIDRAAQILDCFGFDHQELGVSEIGAALFSLVAHARAAGVDPELELRAAARSYRERVRRWAEDQSRDRA